MSSAQASSERKSSSFANPTKSNRVNKRIKPLTRDFFTQLIKLEADFHNKVYTVSTLDELIQFYAKAVEYYDSIKDEISAYFIFKIQDILATKKSLKMLLDQNAKGIAKRGVPSGSADYENDANPEKSSQKKVTFGDAEPKQDNILEESSEEDEDDEEKHLSEFDKKRTAKRKERAKDRLSISRMKNEKQRFVNFFYKMETQKVSEKQNMNVVMNEFGSMSQKNDSYVKKDIDYQKDRLRKRIDKKKGENYMSHTMNLQSFQLGNSADDHQDRKDDIIYENFLEGLGSHREEFSKDDSDRTDNGSLTDNQMLNENTQHTRSNFGPRSMNEGSHTHSPSNQTSSNQSLSAGAIQEAHMTSES